MKNILLILLGFVVFNSCRFQSKEIKGKSIDKQNIELKKEFEYSIIKQLKKIEFPFDTKDIDNLIINNDDGYYLDIIITKNNIDNYYAFVENNKQKAIINKKIISVFDGIADVKIKNSIYQNSNYKTLFPFWYYKKNDYLLIGSFIQYFGENDIPGTSFVLTSFDREGKMIDNLMIYNRFNWELSLKSNFKIFDKFNKIVIKNIEEDWLLFNDSGDIVGERTTPEVKEVEKVFMLNKKGFFEL